MDRQNAFGIEMICIFVSELNALMVQNRTIFDERKLSISKLTDDYPNASILRDNRIVFNIKGNDYRLIVKFNFEYQLAWIRFIGTHAEYDKINANEI